MGPAADVGGQVVPGVLDFPPYRRPLGVVGDGRGRGAGEDEVEVLVAEVALEAPEQARDGP